MNTTNPHINLIPNQNYKFEKSKECNLFGGREREKQSSDGAESDSLAEHRGAKNHLTHMTLATPHNFHTRLTKTQQLGNWKFVPTFSSYLSIYLMTGLVCVFTARL